MTTTPTTTTPTTTTPERPAATLPLPIWLAYAIAAISVIAGVVLLVAVAVSDTSWTDALEAHQLHNIDLDAVLGALVLRQRPGHVIGWVLVAVSGFEVITLLSRAYQFFGLPAGAVVENQLSGFWVPGSACLLIALPQLFPDGRLLSRRWRPLALFGVAAATLLTATFFLFPAGPDDSTLAPVAFPLFGLAALASFVPLAVRFRRSRGVQRQQFKWVFYGLAIGAVLIGIGGVQIVAGGESLGNSALTLVAQGIIPVAVTIAMLRYRLYDVDLVINKTVVFVVLAGFITAVYAGIVVGIGRLLPIGQANLGLAIAATALVAVVFEPVRARVQHWANQLVYGRRASPYEALAAMTARVGDTADPGAALAEAAKLLAEGTGAARAVVWVAQDGRLVPRASAGVTADDPPPVLLLGSELPDIPGTDLAQPVRQEGELVGALTLTKRPGEGVSTADRRLVEELAGQAALLLANTRLRSRLTDRLAELRASRRRMLDAQDRARHALERDLHDGAQQELVALKIKLGLARTIATREGADDLAADLADTATVADQAVNTLREVARGIYPPLLESEGLHAALVGQSRRGDLAVTVLDRGTTRYPREVEATAYFCAVEALQNAVQHADAEHAHIQLDGTDSTLTVSVADDGAGFDPDNTVHGAGLTHMTDRADAAGGTLTVDSRPGHGTTITLALPVPAAVAAEPAAR